MAFASPLIPQANFLLAQNPVSEAAATKMPTQEFSHSEDISQETQPVEQKQEEKIPVVKATGRTYPQPPNPYDMEAMEKFDQEVYGEGN